jgi:hypothetical protein
MLLFGWVVADLPPTIAAAEQDLHRLLAIFSVGHFCQKFDSSKVWKIAWEVLLVGYLIYRLMTKIIINYMRHPWAHFAHNPDWYQFESFSVVPTFSHCCWSWT